MQILKARMKLIVKNQLSLLICPRNANFKRLCINEFTNFFPPVIDTHKTTHQLTQTGKLFKNLRVKTIFNWIFFYDSRELSATFRLFIILFCYTIQFMRMVAVNFQYIYFFYRSDWLHNDKTKNSSCFENLLTASGALL
jgi:hypothetical protein